MRIASGWRRVALALLVSVGGALPGCTSQEEQEEEEVRRETEGDLPGGSDQPDVEPRPSLPEPSPPPEPEPLTIDSFEP